jgi:hypothetical protein
MISEKKVYINNFSLEYNEDKIETSFNAFSQRWFDFIHLKYNILRRLSFIKKKNYFNFFLFLDRIEIPLELPMILDITLKIENREKGRSLSKSVIGVYEHVQDKSGFNEFINASKIKEDGYISGEEILFPLTLLWVNVFIFIF